MNNKNIKPQLTKLNSLDVITYEDDYIELLIGNKTDIPNKCFSIYCSYAIEELANTKQRFSKTFEEKLL